MSDTKPPMTSSYKGVFIFTIVMAVFVFFMSAISGSKSQIGTLIWGYTAWLMYKRKNSQLVSMYKFLLWLTGFVAVLMFFVFLSYGETLDYSGTGLFFLFILVFLVDYSLLKFFQKMVDNEFHAVRSTYAEPATNTTPTITNEQIWEMASKELVNNKREGLWAKCFSQSNGDENKARALYLRSRVSEIKKEFNITSTTKDYATNLPILNEAKEWWDNLNFIGKVCVLGLALALLAYFFGWIDG